MANSLEDILTRAIAPLGSGEIVSLEEQLQQLREINQAQVEIAQNNSRVVSQPASSESGGSVLGDIASGVESFLGFGFGLGPAISGIASLFGGGGDASEPAPLTPFVLPAPVRASAGFSGSSAAFAVDSAQGGSPRAVTQQVTVQVQALDSQSFLDRSGDIAMAVRKAMLESSVLNDVIREV